MNDEVWDQSTAWDEMLRVVWSGFLPYRPSPRKLRLWTVACCRQISAVHRADPQFFDYELWFDQHVNAWESQLEAAERYADGTIDKKALHDSRAASGGPWNVFHLPMLHSRLTISGAVETLRDFSNEFHSPTASEIASLVRDIFGNPFRPVAFDPAWRTEHTAGIAAKMYDERDFAAMPILADALEEAGCDSETVLSHCREPGVHVRGCWVVDLVLGKA